mgnify:CR=1 FL=1
MNPSSSLYTYLYFIMLMVMLLYHSKFWVRLTEEIKK